MEEDHEISIKQTVIGITFWSVTQKSQNVIQHCISNALESQWNQKIFVQR